MQEGDIRVVPSFRFEDSAGAAVGRCLLRLADGGNRLDCHTEVEVSTVGDATKRAAGVVRLRCELDDTVLQSFVAPTHTGMRQ
jgi:hypothetical protein